MIYAILPILFIFLYLPCEYYCRIELDKKVNLFDFIIENLRSIFSESTRVVFYSSVKNTVFFIIEYKKNKNRCLAINISDDGNKIIFYDVPIRNLYSSKKNSVLSWSKIFSVTTSDLNLYDNKILSFFRNYIWHLSTRFNSAKNKKIIFDGLYDFLMEMKRKTNGDSNSIYVRNAKPIQNLFI